MPSTSYDATIIMPPMWHIREPWTAPAYICEALRTKGYRVQFLDYNVRLYHLCEKLGYSFLWEDGGFFKTWCSDDLNYFAHLFDLDEIAGGVIGISCTQTSWSFGRELGRLIRARFPQRKIIFGGHSLYFAEEASRIPTDAADAICRGEGEHTICELMERGFGAIGDIPGLYVPSANGWRLTSERPQEKQLDALAWPRFEGINLDDYGKHFLPLMGARGCIGRCEFCPDRYRTPGFRTRSAVNQVDELEYLSGAFDVEHFPYNDPLMNGHVGVLKQKAEEILRRGLKVQYGGNMMVRAEMPDDLFPLLRKSGMSVALVGIESGSAGILRSMRKRHTPEMAAAFLKNLHNVGIKTEINFILGYPSETETHFEETCRFVRDNRANIDAVISIMPCLIQPSDLYDHRAEYGIEMESPTSYFTWWTRDRSNTYEIRLDRVERFRRMCEDLGLLEDHVMSDMQPGAEHIPPVPTKFLGEFRASGVDNPDLCEQEREANGKIAERLDQYIRACRHKMTPITLLGKALNSVRRHGLRTSVRRGGEWMKLNLR
jgi:hypothetical protein